MNRPRPTRIHATVKPEEAEILEAWLALASTRKLKETLRSGAIPIPKTKAEMVRRLAAAYCAGPNGARLSITAATKWSPVIITPLTPNI